MNSYDHCRKIGDLGVSDVSPLIASRSNGVYMVIKKGANAEFLQKNLGDIIMQTLRGETIFIEVKTEVDFSPNLFLEEWSNRDYEMRTPGWMRTLKCDLLFYYFLSRKVLYVIQFRKLWEWCYGKGMMENGGAIYKFPEKPQKKHDQPNITVGRLVPTKTIRDAIGMKEFEIDDDKQWKENKVLKQNGLFVASGNAYDHAF